MDNMQTLPMHLDEAASQLLSAGSAAHGDVIDLEGEDHNVSSPASVSQDPFFHIAMVFNLELHSIVFVFLALT